MLKEQRLKVGLSQWELAAKAGLSIKTVWRAEMGKGVSPQSESRINEVLEREGINELLGQHRGTVDWLTKMLPISIPANVKGYDNSTTIERMEDGFVIWAPEKPWAVAVDGYMVNTSKATRLSFITLEETPMKPSIYVWPDLVMALTQALSSVHLSVASKRAAQAMDKKEHQEMMIMIEERTKVMSAFEKAGYPGKVKERERLLQKFERLSKEKSAAIASNVLIEEIGNF